MNKTQFLSNYLFKFVAVGGEKFTAEEDGYDGFGLKLLIVKSRTNQAGQTMSMIYDKVRRVDSLRSCVEYAKDKGYLGGNKNGYYFTENKDMKFTKFGMHQDFKDNPELYKLMYSLIIPELEERLSAITPEEMEIVEEEMNY